MCLHSWVTVHAGKKRKVVGQTVLACRVHNADTIWRFTIHPSDLLYTNPISNPPWEIGSPTLWTNNSDKELLGITSSPDEMTRQYLVFGAI